MAYRIENLSPAQAQAAALEVWQHNRSDNAALHRRIFDWYYHGHPSQQARCFVLYADDGLTSTAVGFAGIAPRTLMFGGQAVQAALHGDFFVDKAHRSFFPALSLQRAVTTWARKNFELVYGFPNDLAVPVLQRLGMKPVVPLTRYACVLRSARHVPIKSRRGAAALGELVDRWMRLRARPMLRGYTFGAESLVLDNAELAEFHRRTAWHPGIVQLRDATFLHWRFMQRTDEACDYFALRSGGQLRGYAFVSRRDQVGYVRDVFVTDSAQLSPLLHALAAHYHAAGVHALSWLCTAAAHVRSAIVAAGWQPRESTRIMRAFAPADVVELPAKWIAPNDWYVTEANEDQ